MASISPDHNAGYFPQSSMMRILLMKEIDGRNTGLWFLFVFSCNALLPALWSTSVFFFCGKGHPQIYTDCMVFFIGHHLWMRKQFFPRFIYSRFFLNTSQIPGRCWIFFIFEIHWDVSSVHSKSKGDLWDHFKWTGGDCWARILRHDICTELLWLC